MKIRIVTDSTSDLPKSLAEQHQIEIIPLKVIFGETAYLDGVTLDKEQFFRQLTTSGVFPSTSQPTPNEFAEVYSRLLADPETHIISLHISANLSGTSQSAHIALTMLSDEQAARVTIVDSKYTCYGLGVMAVEMAKAAADGASIEQCLDVFRQIRQSIRLYFMVDTLEYLQKGGRIGKASAWIGSLLNIKPILTIDQEGLVAPVDRVRGQSRAFSTIVERLVADFSAHHPSRLNMIALHSRALATAERLAGICKTRFSPVQPTYAEIGPVLGTHVGPGAVAVIMYADPQGSQKG